MVLSQLVREDLHVVIYQKVAQAIRICAASRWFNPEQIKLLIFFIYNINWDEVFRKNYRQQNFDWEFKKPQIIVDRR